MWVEQCHEPPICWWFIHIHTIYLWWFGGWFMIVLPMYHVLNDGYRRQISLWLGTTRSSFCVSRGVFIRGDRATYLFTDGSNLTKQKDFPPGSTITAVEWWECLCSLSWDSVFDIYIYTYMYMYIYIYTYVWYIYMYTYIYIYTCIYTVRTFFRLVPLCLLDRATSRGAKWMDINGPILGTGTCPRAQPRRG